VGWPVSVCFWVWGWHAVGGGVLERVSPNKRLKLAGGDRFRETEYCALAGTDCRPTARAGGRLAHSLSAIR